jgi:hypothetical protein
MTEHADVQTVEVTSKGALDPEWVAMEIVCKKAAMLLARVYPNHLWMIGSAPGGVLCIKHGAGDSKFGYTIDVPSAASVSELEHAIIMGGGEMLERMGLPRGAWDGEGFGLQYEGADAAT